MGACGLWDTGEADCGVLGPLADLLWVVTCAGMRTVGGRGASTVWRSASRRARSSGS